MFWDRLSIQPTWIVLLFRMAIGSDSDLNENDKDRYQQFVQENEIEICEEILINFLMYQNLILQLTHHILISIPIPSTSQFSQLTHQFKQISIPILSSKVLLMYLMTFPLAFNLTISLYANQLMY